MTYFRISAFFIILTVLTFVRSAPVASDDDDFRETMNSLQREMEALRKHEQHQVEELQKQIEELRGSLNKAVRSWRDDTQITADSTFLATISAQSVSISEGEPIIWDSAPINPGGHFNTILGLYEAPVDGYYTFSVNKYGNGGSGTFHFLVDEKQVAHHYIYTGSSCCPNGGATVNLELSAGQVVRIENSGSTIIYGTDRPNNMFSWFTGHLLYAL